MSRSRIKSTAELAKLDFSKIDEEQFTKIVGPRRIELLKSYFSKIDLSLGKAQSKRERKRKINLELKSRMK